MCRRSRRRGRGNAVAERARGVDDEHTLDVPEPRSCSSGPLMLREEGVGAAASQHYCGGLSYRRGSRSGFRRRCRAGDAVPGHSGCVNENWIWIWPTFRDRAGLACGPGQGGQPDMNAAVEPPVFS